MKGSLGQPGPQAFPYTSAVTIQDWEGSRRNQQSMVRALKAVARHSYTCSVSEAEKESKELGWALESYAQVRLSSLEEALFPVLRAYLCAQWLCCSSTHNRHFQRNPTWEHKLCVFRLNTCTWKVPVGLSGCSPCVLWLARQLLLKMRTHSQAVPRIK